MGEAAPSRSWHQRVRDAVTDRRLLAYVLMPLLLACAFALLIALNVLLRSLWGELAYAILVTGVALWALSQTTLVDRLFVRLGVRPFTIRRAILWATFALVALPVAGDRGWRGLLILLAPLVGLAIFRGIQALETSAGDDEYKPRAWPAAVAGMVALLLLVQAVPSPAENDAEPGALPLAAEENAEHAELAGLVRPYLLFDRREARFPLDIEDAARAGRISSCSGDECKGVRRAAALDRSANFVEIADFTGERGGGPGSAYYYHVVDKDRPNRIYVDYWWYFTRNPSPIGAAVGCGPGARWVGVTCHDHPSDWEGITVVLGPCPDAEPGLRPERGGALRTARRPLRAARASGLVLVADADRALAERRNAVTRAPARLRRTGQPRLVPRPLRRRVQAIRELPAPQRRFPLRRREARRGPARRQARVELQRDVLAGGGRRHCHRLPRADADHGRRSRRIVERVSRAVGPPDLHPRGRVLRHEQSPELTRGSGPLPGSRQAGAVALLGRSAAGARGVRRGRPGRRDPP